MQTYSHSGTVPPPGGLATAGAGLAAAALAGFLYAFAFHWIPIGFLRLGLLAVYCLVVGGSISWAATSGKVRSPLFVTIAALVCAVFGLWIYWGAYRLAKDGLAVGLTAWTPEELAAFGQRLFVEGSFKLRRHTIDGWPLVAFWIAEAATMLYAIVSLARSEVARPFCEACDVWSVPEATPLRFAASGDEPAWAQILAGDFAELGRFETATAETPEHVRLNLASCPKCAQSNFLTITRVAITTGKKGKREMKEYLTLQNAMLTSTQAEMLRALARMLQAEPEAQPEAEAAEPFDAE